MTASRSLGRGATHRPARIADVTLAIHAAWSGIRRGEELHVVTAGWPPTS